MVGVCCWQLNIVKRYTNWCGIQMFQFRAAFTTAVNDRAIMAALLVRVFEHLSSVFPV